MMAILVLCNLDSLETMQFYFPFWFFTDRFARKVLN